ncbi:MAG: hypothetical protein V7733_08100 [Paraglaciecola polaris]|uniref:hypothetical protein n=1 Tax=Paraglaciecola polaris TaxID=222814 RepID=UPI003002C85C
MSKQDWLVNALASLEFFVTNPEYKGEFGHEYFADLCNVSRQTLSRNKKYMTRYKEVREILKGHKIKNSETGPITGDKEKIKQLNNTIEKQKEELDELKIRLNDCYQMLEDHGIDPQFAYPTRRKKHKEA